MVSKMKPKIMIRKNSKELYSLFVNGVVYAQSRNKDYLVKLVNSMKL